ncbi:response regulator [Hyphococcus sp.]|uniref:response regulator n=1 Tax=Hyphococcus sp. TaxID=2038636 RepID=UPI003CCBCE14
MTPAASSGANLRELIVVCDADGLIRFVSQSFSSFFGAPAESWHGRAFAPGDNAARPGAPAVYKTAARLGGGEAILAWTETALSGGERLYVGKPEHGRQTADTDADADNDVNIDAPGKPANQASAPAIHASADDPKLQLLATMSHEMRTPLNGILGMTSLLMDTPLEPNQRAYAESVRESGVALLALINDLLDFTKIEAGHMEIEQNTFSPAGLVQGVAELLSPKAADKNIELAAFVDSAIPLQLNGDEARLRQVLINLAGNGVKFTDKGGVAIEARLDSAENGLARVAFCVRDTGVGVEPDKHATIFEEYAQASLDVARKREGTGLGLAIARKIVRAMGGDITLVSAPGAGSAFSFTVTLAYEGALPGAPEDFQTPVVIATRSPVLARNLRQQLKSIGARTIVAADSPNAAIKAMKAHDEAVLLSDTDIAEESPRALCDGAARSYVLLSPQSRGRIADLREAGFDGYFIKPTRQSSLHKQLLNDEPADRQEQAAPAAEKKGRTYSVLLAEDNQINAVLATTIIKRAGHRVDVAHNGLEAVEAVNTRPYDLILMDLHMPEMDGLEAAKQIRNLNSDMRRIPIIALTASAMAADRQKCIAAGMDDFLSKPFEPDDLTGLLAKWGDAQSTLSEAS